MTDRKKIEQAKLILLLGKLTVANFHINPKEISKDDRDNMRENVAQIMGELAVMLDLTVEHHKKASIEISVAVDTFFDMLEVPN